MVDDESSNIFEGIPAGGVDSSSDAEAEGETASIPVYSERELSLLGREALNAHVLRLQDAYVHSESDNKFLSWELRECRDSLSYFSSANKLAHKLNACDIETVAAVAIHEIPAYFACGFGSLFLYDAQTSVFELYRSSSPAPESIRPLHAERDAEHFLIRLFFEFDDPFVVQYRDGGELTLYDNDSFRTSGVPADWYRTLGDQAMVFPLRVKSAERGEELLLGGLLIGAPQRDLTAKDAEIATVFSDLLASSLYNAKLVQRLNEMTIVDPLTLIYNRRHLIDQLNSAMIRATRYTHSLSIAMIDIDFFKRLNDACGHLYGDEVLKSVAEILRGSIRSGVDIAARYGGEEFMLLMPYTPMEHALDVSDRVRKKIKETAFVCNGHTIPVTCSIGVAEYVSGETLEMLIDRADVALYEAKNSGRDRICSSAMCRME